MSRPPAKKPMTATSDTHCRFERPAFQTLEDLRAAFLSEVERCLAGRAGAT